MDAGNGEKGSTDRQVTGSYRIETREIEQVLQYHPAIKQAVVIVREDTRGEKRLIAYLMPYPGERCAAADLRDLLRSALPEYMIPQTLFLLEQLPLTPNDQIDRRALPLPRPEDPPDIGFGDPH